MRFFVVLHHPRNPHQPWANAWVRGTDDQIEAITTTHAIAKRCKDEGRVLVHRCGFDREPPAVVCEAEFVRADRLGGQTMVTFKTTRTMRAVPKVVPSEGQNFYEGEEPPAEPAGVRGRP